MELPSQSEYHSDSVANPDGLIGGFISHIVGDIMTSKQDMVSDHELEVVQVKMKMKTQNPSSSSGCAAPFYSHSQHYNNLLLTFLTLHKIKTYIIN